jgi:hypothetical protein
MESPIEFHSQKPDNWVADLCGFGCADYNPGRCFNTDRGLLFHTSIILDPLMSVKHKALDFHYRVKYHRSMPRHKISPETLAYFKRMGKKGGKIGGNARAASLTPERRKEIAQKAIAARWAKRSDAASSSPV